MELLLLLLLLLELRELVELLLRRVAAGRLHLAYRLAAIALGLLSTHPKDQLVGPGLVDVLLDVVEVGCGLRELLLVVPLGRWLLLDAPSAKWVLFVLVDQHA